MRKAFVVGENLLGLVTETQSEYLERSQHHDIERFCNFPIGQGCDESAMMKSFKCTKCPTAFYVRCTVH